LPSAPPGRARAPVRAGRRVVGGAGALPAGAPPMPVIGRPAGRLSRLLNAAGRPGNATNDMPMINLL
jgi:hypothetical protein